MTYKVISSQVKFGQQPELSLRGGGWGFAPATRNVNIEEKQNQKKPLAVWFPAYLLYLPGNLKS